MKNNVFFLSIVILSLNILFSQEKNSQSKDDEKKNGTVQGTISSTLEDDIIIGDPVIGCAVFIKDTKIFTTVDTTGRFIMKNVPIGKYQVIFQASGYEPKTANVEVVAGKITFIRVTMNKEYNIGATIRGARARNTAKALLEDRKKAVEVKNSISAEEIAKSPDSDAEGAAKRVTGVDSFDGNIFIRGLGERYSLVLFSRSLLPSPNPDKRVISLDVFPVSVLENISVNKTYNGWMPSEFGGGLIQISPKSFPEKQKLKISVGLSGNSSTTFQKRYSYTGGSLDWFGLDDGTRALPKELENAKLNTFNTRGVQGIGRQLSPTFTPQNNETALPNGKISLSYGNSFKVNDNIKIGLVTSALYGNKHNTREVDYLRKRFDLVDQKRYKISYSSYQTSKSLFGSLALNYFSQDLRLTSFFTHRSEDEAKIIEGTNTDRDGPIKQYKLQFVETSLFFNSLTGNNFVKFSNKLGSELFWEVSYVRAARNEPDSREIDLLDLNEDGKYFLERADSITRRWQSHYDDIYNAVLDINTDLRGILQFPLKVTIGGSISSRERNSVDTSYGYRSGNGGSEEDTPEPLEELFKPENIFGSAGDLKSNPTRFYLIDSTATAGDYIGKLFLMGGYLQLSAKFFDRLTVSSSLRYEYADMDVIAFDPFQSTNVSLKEERAKEGLAPPVPIHNFIPNANFTYNINNEQNLRLAFSKTLARADFREITKFKYTLMTSSEVVLGNPQLKQSEIYNGDIRYEWFLKSGGVFSVSGFYKHIAYPIELLSVPGSDGTETYQFANAESAANLGVEIEMDFNFGFISKVLKPLNMVFNLTMTSSKIDIEFDNPEDKVLNVEYTRLDRPLQGQSPYIFNINLNYDNKKNGLTTGILYNIKGRKITGVGLVGSGVKQNDIYQEITSRLDFLIKKKVLKNGSVKLTVKNILDPEIQETQEIKETTVVRNSYKKGLSMGMSMSYSF